AATPAATTSDVSATAPSASAPGVGPAPSGTTAPGSASATPSSPPSPDAGASPSNAPPAPTDTPAAPTEAPAWVVSVPDIALDNLKISGEDRHVTPGVTVRLSDLRLHVGGFTTARTNPVAVTLSTKINNDSKLDVKADLTPDLTGLKAETELANLDLTV